MKQVTIKLVLFAYLTVLIGMLGCGGSGGDGGEPDPGDEDIVGSWGRGHYSYDDVEYESITFYPNGYYIYCDSNSRDAGCGIRNMGLQQSDQNCCIHSHLQRNQ